MCKFLLYQILIIICSYSYCVTSYLAEKYAEDTCGSGNGVGVCKVITECSTARTAVARSKHHGLERCGFSGIFEIVCCPDSTEELKVAKNTSIWGRIGPKPSPRPSPTPTPTPLFRPSPTPTLSTTSDNNLVNRLPLSERISKSVCKLYSETIPPNINFLILGGELAQLGEFPHMAQLGFINNDDDGYNWECGASLISTRHVLTAAHCIFKSDGTSPVRVRMGLVDIRGRDGVIPQEFGIQNFYVHDNYSRRSKENDIAIIELDGEVERNINVQPVCLYQNNDDPDGLIISGWGYTDVGGNPSDLLLKAKIHAVGRENCSSIYQRRISRTITSHQICCLSNDGTVDTCQGDSGGPLQIQISKDSNIYTLVGVTSFGMGCGGSTPGVYTRVSSYLDWIENIVWP